MINKNKIFMLCIVTIVLHSHLIVNNVIAQRNNNAAGGYTTPVPILKQINRHNDDGSYSYGYEAADGSFKIETKYPNGEVYGKYGYVDDGGKLREVEYGASKRGFEPQGNDINVPPPTLTNNNPNLTPLGPNEEDDGQYREDPSFYYKGQGFKSRPIPASNFRLNDIEQRASPRAYNSAPVPPVHNHQPAQYRPPPPPPVAPRYDAQPFNHQQRSYYAPPPPPPSNNPYYNVNVPSHHHPALQNLDIWSGSYSISYTGRRR